jgi:hypothetical protein
MDSASYSLGDNEIAESNSQTNARRLQPDFYENPTSPGLALILFTCSLNDPDSLIDVDARRLIAGAGTEGEVAHLALDAAGIAAIAAGDCTFIKDFVENGVMKCLPLPRGE